MKDHFRVLLGLWCRAGYLGTFYTIFQINTCVYCEGHGCPSEIIKAHTLTFCFNRAVSFEHGFLLCMEWSIETGMLLILARRLRHRHPSRKIGYLDKFCLFGYATG